MIPSIRLCDITNGYLQSYMWKDGNTIDYYLKTSGFTKGLIMDFISGNTLDYFSIENEMFRNMIEGYLY